jgi:hypothetical protein
MISTYQSANITARLPGRRAEMKGENRKKNTLRREKYMFILIPAQPSF